MCDRQNAEMEALAFEQGFEIGFQNGRSDVISETVELRLCEQNHLILKPDQFYIFTVDENCEKCLELAKQGNVNEYL